MRPQAPSPSEFPLSSRPIVVFAGPFGGGKTEIAIHYALAALAEGRKTCIVDLDIVTPYFRVGDHRRKLSEMGLQVIAPEGALASFELPALPPEISGALRREDRHVVLDTGGDPVGACLLAAFAPEITARGCDLWLVANPFRPSSSSPKALADQARAIEATSQLRLTGLVANPHLGSVTQPAHLQTGLETVRQGAALLGLPVVFLGVARSLLDDYRPPALPVLPLDLLVRLPWDLG